MMRKPGMLVGALVAVAFCVSAWAQPTPGGPPPPGSGPSGGPTGGGTAKKERPEKPPEFTGSILLRIQLEKDGQFPSVSSLQARLEKVTGVTSASIGAEDRLVRCSYVGALAGIGAVVSAAGGGSTRAIILDPVRFDVNLNPQGGGTINAKDVEEALRTTAQAVVVKNLGSGDFSVYAKGQAATLTAFEKIAKDFRCKLKVSSHEIVEVKLQGLDKVDGGSYAALQAAILNLRGVLECVLDLQIGCVRMLAEKGRVKASGVGQAVEKFGCKLPEPPKKEEKKEDPRKDEDDK